MLRRLPRESVIVVRANHLPRLSRKTYPLLPFICLLVSVDTLKDKLKAYFVSPSQPEPCAAKVLALIIQLRLRRIGVVG